MGSFDLYGKNIVITGVSSGIGRACAVACSELGANIVGIARNSSELDKTLSLLKAGSHLFYSQDITDLDTLENIISESVSKIGKITGFIHSAGIEASLPLKIMTKSLYENMFLVNTIACFELARIISKKKYIARDRSSFVFISSVMGSLGQPAKTAYCSSKGALIAGTKAMSLELSSKNITVNTVSPGMVKTEMFQEMQKTLSEESLNEIVQMHPMGLGTPDDVANACVFLLSNAAKWITGIDLKVDGGYSAR